MQLIHSGCGCFCWALPRFLLLCLVCFLTKRISGWGICGSSGVVPLCFLLVWFGCGLLHRIWPQCHVHSLFANSLLFSLGPSLVRHRPSWRKKKEYNGDHEDGLPYGMSIGNDLAQLLYVLLCCLRCLPLLLLYHLGSCGAFVVV